MQPRPHGWDEIGFWSRWAKGRRAEGSLGEDSEYDQGAARPVHLGSKVTEGSFKDASVRYGVADYMRHHRQYQVESNVRLLHVPCAVKMQHAVAKPRP